MHSRLEEVLNYLDSQRAALSEAVQLVPAEMRNQKPGTDAGPWLRFWNIL